MPKPTEYAEIVVNGQSFSDWETVRVEIDYFTAARTAQFSVSEAITKGPFTFASLQIKPGDSCTIMLAGELVLTGWVYQRQAAYDANNHGVLISAYSKTADLGRSSAPLKDTQMRGNAFAPIVRKLIEPFGISLNLGTQPPGADTPFKDMSVWPGETVWQCIERLARQRNLFVHDDAQGSLVAEAGTNSGGPIALTEGENIKSATCLLNDNSKFSTIGAIGPQRGDDDTDGEAARSPSAYVDGTSDRHSPLILIAEEPGNDEDMKRRANRGLAHSIQGELEVTVVVYGWLKPNGGLWNRGDAVHVKSPMLLLDHDLAITAVVFSQDDGGGTQTTLTILKKDAIPDYKT